MWHKSQKGFSLVEVLVAVVLLALGLLGFAGLQVTGLRYASNAALRFNVSSQINDISDRIRANMVGFNNGSYFTTGSPDSGHCIISDCTPAVMAATDLQDWNASNSRLLPTACLSTGTSIGTVTTAASGKQAILTLNWCERQAYNTQGFSTSSSNAAFVQKTYSITFQP